MAQRTYTIPDAQLQRILNGVVYQNGYTDNIKDANGNTIPNPVSKTQFFDQVTYRFWKESVKAYESSTAAETARLAALASADSIPLP